MPNPWKKLLANVKISGRRAHLQHGKPKKKIFVNHEDLEKIFNKQDKKCYWFNLTLNPEWIFESNHSLALSVDRLDNDGEYTKDNIVICSRLANLGRGSATVENFDKQVRLIKNSIRKEILTEDEKILDNYINERNKLHPNTYYDLFE